MIRNDELEASSTLERNINQIVSNEFSQNLSHRWAIFIHGKILTRLAATSLKLETASKQGDLQTFKQTTDSLLALLSCPESGFEQEIMDLQTELATRLDPWTGLLDINLHIDQDLKSIINARVRDVGEVIEELISNSVRHGKAKKMDLRLTSLDQKVLTIIAIDNATNPPPEFSFRSGLGTRIFNLASDGRWSITRIGSTTEFRLTMEVEF
jgi:two-component sensor histidine kinase